MKRSIVALMGAALVLALAMPTLAQGGGQGGGGNRGGGGFGGGRMGGGMMGGRGGGGLNLLRNESVQKELAMTQPQIDKLDTAQQDVRKAMQDAMPAGGMQAMQTMSDADRAKLMEKMTEVQTKAVADILDTKQIARFTEIELQQAGPRAFTQKAVETKLVLTEAQKASIKKILDDARTAQQAAMQGVDFRTMTPEDRAKRNTEMEATTKATLDKIVALLTPKQAAAWTKMLGKPFKLIQPVRQPGQGGGRGNGGAPAGN